MATTTAPLALALHDIAVPAAPARKSFFVRFLDALAMSRQRAAEHEIARFLATAGGKFTDDTEREIERRFLSGPRW
jgi:hypothetical protein